MINKFFKHFYTINNLITNITVGYIDNLVKIKINLVVENNCAFMYLVDKIHLLNNSFIIFVCKIPSVPRAAVMLVEIELKYPC